MTIQILTTGGTIDKVYFDSASEYTVGEPTILEILRVAGDLPDEERDLGEKTLLHELDRAEAWSSFTKGCYLGQETVARVHSRGRTHRTLRALLVETQTVPAPAALVLREGGRPERTFPRVR